METAEQYRKRAAEMRAMAKKVQPGLASRYLELAEAYDQLAEQRAELVAVRANLEKTSDTSER